MYVTIELNGIRFPKIVGMKNKIQKSKTENITTI